MNCSIRFTRDQVIRLWFQRQGLHRPRGRRFTRSALVDHLERTGALQLDSVNVVDRAHHLTLWSRFGPYSRETLADRIHRESLAHEYWGHAASVLPQSSLPFSRRHMRLWDPGGQWWEERKADEGLKRRVLARIRREGPLESAQFDAERRGSSAWWGWKDSRMALEWLWRKGKLAICDRRHFRRVYDIADRVYPDGPPADRRSFEEHWVLGGLSGNGVATHAHLSNYLTIPIGAAQRRAVIARLLKRGAICKVAVEGSDEDWYALPEHLDSIGRAPRPRGTNLICPFDSLLWQRKRAEELLDFHYRIEIYVPRPKRVFGYYVLPILHDGRFVGRLDPKFDRQADVLRIHAIHLEPGVAKDGPFRPGLGEAIRDLARFLGAGSLELPRGWRDLDN